MINKAIQTKLEKALRDGTFQNPEQPSTELDIIWLMANPVYAGIDPCPACVTEEALIKVFTRLINDVGVELAFKAMLTTLRQTYSLEEDIPDLPPMKAR
jgi:hypothetical protein